MASLSLLLRGPLPLRSVLATNPSCPEMNPNSTDRAWNGDDADEDEATTEDEDGTYGGQKGSVQRKEENDRK